MTARLLDGKQLAQTLQAEIADGAAEFLRVARHASRASPRSWSATIPPASFYVRNKRKACEKAGIDSWLHELPEGRRGRAAARPRRPAQRRSRSARHPRATAAAEADRRSRR